MPRRTATERRTLAARRLMGDKRVIAFLRMARTGYEREIAAVKWANDLLDQGGDARSVFEPWVGTLASGSGFFLTARRTAPHAYHVAFGCVAGPQTGDGGEWNVVFDTLGRVRRIDQLTMWIS